MKYIKVYIQNNHWSIGGSRKGFFIEKKRPTNYLT